MINYKKIAKNIIFLNFFIEVDIKYYILIKKENLKKYKK